MPNPLTNPLDCPGTARRPSSTMVPEDRPIESKTPGFLVIAGDTGELLTDGLRSWLRAAVEAGVPWEAVEGRLVSVARAMYELAEHETEQKQMQEKVRMKMRGKGKKKPQVRKRR